jgi:predicted RNase H-like HicB family nuclease
VNHQVVLEPEPNGGLVAYVPALPGCVSQGDSREEAMANIAGAIDLYTEDCLAAGDPVPEEGA